MNQDDIYNLLLLLLLMSNERDGDDANTCRSTRGSLNELIIASLLLNSCNNGGTASTTPTCPNRNNTTF